MGIRVAKSLKAILPIHHKTRKVLERRIYQISNGLLEVIKQKFPGQRGFGFTLFSFLAGLLNPKLGWAFYFSFGTMVFAMERFILHFFSETGNRGTTDKLCIHLSTIPS